MNVGQELIRRLKRFTDNMCSIMNKQTPQSDLPLLLIFISLTDKEIEAIGWAQKEAHARSKIWTAGDHIGLGEGMKVARYSDTLHNLLQRIKNEKQTINE